MKFSHLHNHTQFSLLDGCSDISKLYQKAVDDEMPALAITDHGNMFGVFHFAMEAKKHQNADKSPKVKPIIGCEFYMVEDRRIQQFTREKKDRRYHQLLLAKNQAGYRSLNKLCTRGFTEGLYSKYPRIDKELIQEHHEGLIATTCCLGAIIPRTIIDKGEAEAEEEFKWWLDIFGDDFYVELQRHGIPEQDQANEVLIKFAEKYNVKLIASNDSHYVDVEDYNSHDLLLCINTGELQSTPILKDYDNNGKRDRDSRFGFFNDQFFLKSTQEMSELFKDIPAAIDNTNEIVDKVDLVNVANDLLLPNFEIPAQFKSEIEYLEFLTYEGAKAKYKILTPVHEERLQFELGVIRDMGFPGYFLIVSDIIQWSRNNDVFVGVGRGSAAGSVVAYCIGITNIDPLKYNLLFERFLNPDRNSMPDIDSDFDDEGRGKVIQYIVQKYGQEQVAQIITHNSMAAKMSIRDVARVMDLELSTSMQLTKLVPDTPGTSLHKILHYDYEQLRDKIDSPEAQVKVETLQKKYKENSLEGEVIREAEKLEGTIRNTGIHAAGILIGPRPLDELMPMSRQKDIELNVTQFDGNVIEKAGAIKIDILGLSNLTIIKHCIQFIEKNHGLKIDYDNLPLDDEKTYELYRAGKTIGTFQFASTGMRQYLKQLKPDKMDDLIALNALYRPGPMSYIPNFIARKHGDEEVTYDLEEMEEFLQETYGITVYQEQVMLLSQKLANFTKGQADTLRKAMGKKLKDVLDGLKEKFLKGCSENGHDKEVVLKIWRDWESFAQYAFNKSHSACYAYLAYQTAYFKANYPAEYMTALLISKSGSIDSLSAYMQECESMGLEVLGPDVNESASNFSVNDQGVIRFGLSAIKGVGDAAVDEILRERKANGAFESMFDLTARVNSSSVNKKALESLVLGGAFDSFEDLHRAQYLYTGLGSQSSNLELIVKYGQSYSKSKAEMTNSLFGDIGLPEIPRPKLDDCEPWSLTETLTKEKEVLGMYLSAHPLDPFKFEINNYPFTTVKEFREKVDELEDNSILGKPARFKSEPLFTVKLAGYLSEASNAISKRGNEYGRFSLTDYSDSFSFVIFSENYQRVKHLLEANKKVVLTVGVGKSQKKDSTRPNVIVSGLSLLENVKKNMTKRLDLYVSLAEIDDGFMELIEKYAERSGKTELGIHIVDKEVGNKCNLIHGRKIEFANDILEAIEEQKNITFEVITK